MEASSWGWRPWGVGEREQLRTESFLWLILDLETCAKFYLKKKKTIKKTTTLSVPPRKLGLFLNNCPALRFTSGSCWTWHCRRPERGLWWGARTRDRGAGWGQRLFFLPLAQSPSKPLASTTGAGSRRGWLLAAEGSGALGTASSAFRATGGSRFSFLTVSSPCGRSDWHNWWCWKGSWGCSVWCAALRRQEICTPGALFLFKHKTVTRSQKNPDQMYSLYSPNFETASQPKDVEATHAASPLNPVTPNPLGQDSGKGQRSPQVAMG